MGIPRRVAQLNPEATDFRNQLFSHSTMVSHLVKVLNTVTKKPNLVAPHWKRKPFNETGPSMEIIVNASDEVSLTTDSSKKYRIRRDKLRARRQITPDITTGTESQ